MTPFRVSRRVEFCDTDMACMVHFANFFRFMESAECEFLRSLGLGVHVERAGESFGFPRVSATCDFIKPARFEDVLDIDVTVQRIGKKSVTYGFDFRKAGEPIAKGQVTSACCRVLDGWKLEAFEIPGWYRERIEPYLATAE
ncbi:MAG: acyl-CoA thioesterase [Gemmataceae bacterium]|nr:acyl-CoA thioesterase [Gemmataceae bacterium]